MYFERGGVDEVLSDENLRSGLLHALRAIDEIKPRSKVFIIPPDFTRFHSKAGVLTACAYEYFGEDRVSGIMPALGTHQPMTDNQLRKMFGDGIPLSKFLVHDWRNDVVTIGTVPSSLVYAASNGKANEPWPAQLNKHLWEGKHDLVLSIGQVVPHEVLGMANYNKNLFVGVGGAQAIHFSHFIGAIYGMERMMGRPDNPLRTILDYASEHFLKDMPVVYVQTVRGKEQSKNSDSSSTTDLVTKDKPLKKVIAYMDEEEYKSTWLGNKAIYRTRMAIADGGDLIVIGPGVETFGEDKEIDQVIRKYGYRTTPEVMKHLSNSRDLMRNLSAAAHLIHASSEGRFTITWCPGKLTKEEIESVGFKYDSYKDVMEEYNVKEMIDGFNEYVNKEGVTEEVYYISKPGAGLWAYKGRFKDTESSISTTGGQDCQWDTSTPLTSFTDAASGSLSSVDAGIGGGPFEQNPEKRQRTV